MNRISVVLILVVTSCLASATAAQPTVSLERAFPYLSFRQPIFMTHSGDGTDRIFVAEQDGIVYVFPNDSTVMRGGMHIYLDLTPVLARFHNEAGLLGLAFHPEYSENGFFYVYYTRSEPNRSVVSRFSVDPEDANRAEPASEHILIEIVQPFLNHQAGMLQFGPSDGYLYISVGDGGDRLDGELHPPDSELHGQNPQTLLGTILRIDVDSHTGDLNYGIPPDNPFVGNTEGWREEIWAYGLRNPWRFSLDGPTSRLWVADVGAKAWEEINLVEKGDNLGWSIMEGTDCFRDPDCDTTSVRLPLVQHPHVGNCNSITGGYVYRGLRRPELVGAYVYGDYCHGYVRLIRYENGEVTEQRELVDSGLRISSFGSDEKGELYVVNHLGTLARFVRGETQTATPEGPDLPPFRLQPNHPNPFGEQTVIRFTLARSGEVELTVFDLLGRVVRTLVTGYRPAGSHEATWDGRSESGHVLSGGLYLYRLRHAGLAETRAMVLQR